MDQFEIWRPVNGFGGYYEASSEGRIRSVNRLVMRENCNDGVTTRLEKGRILQPVLNSLGYPRVHLSREGKRTKIYVHTLVCEAFHGPRPDGTFTAHNDGVPTNCRAENLRWATPKENADDRVLHGTHPAGEKHPGALMSSAQVLAIRAESHCADDDRRLAPIYGVSARTIQKIRLRENWTHI